MLEQKPQLKVDPDLDPEPDPDPDPDPDPEVEIGQVPALLESELYPALKLEAELDTEASWNEESDFEEPMQLVCKIESVHSNMGLPTPQTFRPWSLNSNYQSFTEENHMSACHHSISAQTSKHLFWANKLIQASEHSLRRAINMQLNNGSAGQPIRSPLREAIPTNALCSEEQLQIPDAHSAPPATSSQAPSPLLSSDLPPPIGLAELITFATSLAMASSSRTDLPSLEHMMKAPPQEALEPSTEPLLTTVEEQEPEKHAETLPEKPREARAPLKSWSQEDKNFAQAYFDFGKPGIKRATIEGQMQLLQPPATSPLLQGGKEDSVPPGKEKENPLLVKIHFKLSAPTTPEK
ncbi:spermatogenesis-associated protein 32 isoform X4 [Hylobates moloch]|nr:spermatogenesis-associated protein 32 isoform X4 [Hylobates moloch]XP_058302146.1 spermatogenesis-associated protein 32 isoform X4 [Hylobates moloch]XP_058302147.1 spermatogenesis-associated protein 32 isoform X4 [Hylobates moloch]